MERCFRSEQWNVSEWCRRGGVGYQPALYAMQVFTVRPASRIQTAASSFPSSVRAASTASTAYAPSAQRKRVVMVTVNSILTRHGRNWAADVPGRGVNRLPVRFWTVILARWDVKYLGSGAHRGAMPRKSQPRKPKTASAVSSVRQNAEDALRESEARFTLFMEHMPAVAFLKDLQGRYVYVNPNFAKLTGRAPGLCPGSSDEEYWPDCAARLKAEDRMRRPDRP